MVRQAHHERNSPATFHPELVEGLVQNIPRGFTLLETLVALAILAVVLTSAFRAVGMATQNSAELQQRLLADWVAQNRLAMHRALADWPSPGVQEGEAEQGGQRFVWREEVQATPNGLFRRIDVSVRLPESTHILASQTGFAVQAR